MILNAGCWVCSDKWRYIKSYKKGGGVYQIRKSYKCNKKMGLGIYGGHLLLDYGIVQAYAGAYMAG